MASFIASHARRFALAAALALGVAGSAQAGEIYGGVTVYHGGGYDGHAGGRDGWRGGRDGWHDGRGGWRGDYRPACHPREAVGKA
nr:hypothetical protein [Nitratireductor sp.]